MPRGVLSPEEKKRRDLAKNRAEVLRKQTTRVEDQGALQHLKFEIRGPYDKRKAFHYALLALTGVDRDWTMVIDPAANESYYVVENVVLTDDQVETLDRVIAKLDSDADFFETPEAAAKPPAKVKKKRRRKPGRPRGS